MKAPLVARCSTSAAAFKLAHFLPLVILVGGASLTASVVDKRSTGIANSGAAAAHVLAWDAKDKTLDPAASEDKAEFEFHVTNTSDREVTIESVEPSCGCTVVDLPNKPWVLAPGKKDSLRGVIDFKGKGGKLTKSILVNSSAGPQTLLVRVNIPAMDAALREQNQKLALVDRQAIFRGDCAKCHAAPASGLDGASLFKAACGICHQSEHRASMVPDLLIVREKRDPDFWRKWITDGKEGTLMPGFAEQHGGPLTAKQIDSLVDYLMKAFPTTPRT